MRDPVVPGDDESAALGWFVGSYRGHRTVAHSGSDPGSGSRLLLVPEHRAAVVVLANSNTVPTFAPATSALDVARADVPHAAAGGTERAGTAEPGEPAAPDEPDEQRESLRDLLPPAVGPIARALASGPEAAAAEFHRLVAMDPAEHDLGDEELVRAVWGAIELHRTDLVWPILG